MDDNEAKVQWRDKAEVTVSEDKTVAYLTIMGEANKYKIEELAEFLKLNGIIVGIILEELKRIIVDDINYTTVAVAKGRTPIHGRDGRFDCNFDAISSKKPIILDDGTVDYNKLGKINLVKEKDLLVTYIPAVEGHDGIDVYGKIITARKPRELTALRGKGFRISDNQLEYFADFDGKAEFTNGKLNVTRLYVVDGDVDQTTGDIQFYGDILITGNVYPNMKVEAYGHITIDGSVESATLISGKDIIIRNGMMGNGKGYVFAKGDVSAKFFEQTTVVAKGNINANTILNCNMNANKSIIVSGNRGAIIGGKVKAIENISAAAIGNKAEMDTYLEVGIDNEFPKRVIELDNLIKTLKDKINENEQKLARIYEQLRNNQTEFLNDIRTNLLRGKIELNAKLNEQIKAREDMLDQKERSLKGTVVVTGRIFPNTNVWINGASDVMHDEIRNVTFTNKRSEIKIYSNSI